MASGRVPVRAAIIGAAGMVVLTAPIAVAQSLLVDGPLESVAVSNMVCSFHCAVRTHFGLQKNSRKMPLSGRCVWWLSLPSTSTQIDTTSYGKFHVRIDARCYCAMRLSHSASPSWANFKRRAVSVVCGLQCFHRLAFF